MALDAVLAAQQPRPRRLLCVDDDPFVLSALQRALRRKASSWEVRFAESGAEALEILATWPADAVLSDVRMPGMNGSSFLERVRRVRPEAVRMVLSGECEIRVVREALAACHQYFPKPVNALDIVRRVDHLADLSDALPGSQARVAVAGIRSLPVSRTVTSAVREALDAGDDLEGVVRLVRADTTLSGSLLRVANSSYFGLPSEVWDVAQAVRFLGRAGVQAELGEPGPTTPELDAFLEGVGRETLAVAAAAREIATARGVGASGLVRVEVVSMLHRIGQIALASSDWGRYARLLARSVHPDGVRALEEAEYGADHRAAGRYLLALWGLPDAIVHTLGEVDGDGEARQLRAILNEARTAVLGGRTS